MSRKVLGRGLDALIGAKGNLTDLQATKAVHTIPIGRIQPNPRQPRREFDPERLRELAHSIQEKGILEPLIVRPLENEAYELIAGERRLRAAELAGHDTVPALIREFQGLESLEVALIENLQRENLNPVEEARAYQRLAEEFGRTHAEISTEVGKDRTTVTNLLRLLRLPAQILDMVSRGTLSAGHARVLLSVGDQEEQIRLAETMAREGWSVRQGERYLAAATQTRVRVGQRETSDSRARPAEVVRVEEALRNALGTEVHLTHGPKGGKVEIHYSGNEELERILELLGVEVH
jgi:ParB family chromosome partitioning protein